MLHQADSSSGRRPLLQRILDITEKAVMWEIAEQGHLNVNLVSLGPYNLDQTWSNTRHRKAIRAQFKDKANQPREVDRT